MRWIVKLVLLGAASQAHGQPATVTVLPSRLTPAPTHAATLQKLVAGQVDVEAYRAVRAQLIYRADGAPDHVLVYLHAKGMHRVDYMKIGVTANLRATEVVRDYRLSAADHAQQPGAMGRDAKCPDETVQLLAFAPNQDDLEQQVTVEVADHAEAKGLKVKRLLLDDATRQNWLDYMTCPNLLGNFYDGDANPSSIVTVDGELTSDDFSTTLHGKFRQQVTNIWLACEAYNDPMLSAVTEDAATRKYAAGINDLEVGPSDKAAACAMEAAIDGQPMTAAFQDCYKKLDTASDQWGFGGPGTDDFYH